MVTGASPETTPKAIIVWPKYGDRVIPLYEDLPPQYYVEFIGLSGRKATIQVERVYPDCDPYDPYKQGTPCVEYTYPEITIDSDRKIVEILGSEIYGVVSEGIRRVCVYLSDISGLPKGVAPLCVTVVTAKATNLINVPEDARRAHLHIVDTLTGAATALEVKPGTAIRVPATPRLFWMLFLEKEGVGRIIGPGFDTGWGNLFIMTFKLTVKTGWGVEEDKAYLARLLLTHALRNSVNSEGVARIAELLEAGVAAPDDIIEVTAPYYLQSLVENFNGFLLGFSLTQDDEGRPVLEAKVLIHAGWFNINWGRVAAYAGLGALFGAPFGPVAAGVGAAIGATLDIAWQIAEQVLTPKSPKKEEIKNTIISKGEEGKRNIDEACDRAINKVNKYEEQGLIPHDVAEELRNEIENIRRVAKESVDMVVKVSVKSVDEAFRLGFEEAMKQVWLYTLIAGVAGLAIGAALAR